MLGTFANLLSSIPTFVFPVFASYKALKTSDPALLTPWLMYWVVLAIALLFESWAGFVLYWIPFYPLLRLLFFLYLILPQTQGARVLYQTHVHPFLLSNELAIDDFISRFHDRAKAAGATYLNHLISYVKHKILNLPDNEPTPPSPPSSYSYAQALFARFNLPNARPATSSVTDFYALLASAVGGVASSNTAGRVKDLADSGTLIPPTVKGEERISFIAAQRERLAILLSALDREASTLQEGEGAGAEEGGKERPKSAMSSRKSEPDFEKIDKDNVEEVGNGNWNANRRSMGNRSVSSGSWLPWAWGGGVQGKGNEGEDVVMKGTEATKGKSSGVDK